MPRSRPGTDTSGRSATVSVSQCGASRTLTKPSKPPGCRSRRCRRRTCRAFEAWNQGGAESAKRFWAEDYEFHDPPNFPDPRVVRGRDVVAAHLKDQTSVLGDLKVTIVDVRARDETVVVRIEASAHGAKSGVDVPVEVTQVFEVAAGRLQRGRIFMTWEEALEAAGLEE
jgi:ketosteroid isomerase-like protein